MKIEINFDKMLDRIKKMKFKYKWMIASIIMLWTTAIMTACGVHEAIQAAGAFTAAIFFIFSLLQFMSDNL